MADTPDTFDPYYKWLGIPREDQPPTHYRLLGINTFEADDDVIENAADGRLRQLKSFQTGQRSGTCQSLMNEVANARVTLLDPNKKAKYDRELRRERAAAQQVPVLTPAPLPSTTPEPIIELQTPKIVTEPYRLAPQPTRPLSAASESYRGHVARRSGVHVSGLSLSLIVLVAIGGALVVAGLGIIAVQILRSSSNDSHTASSSSRNELRENSNRSRSAASSGSNSNGRRIGIDEDDPTNLQRSTRETTTPLGKTLSDARLVLTFDDDTMHREKPSSDWHIDDARGGEEHAAANVSESSYGRVGKGLEFDGRNTFLRTTIEQSETLTIAMWIRYEHFGEFAQLIAGSHDNQGYAINIKPDQPRHMTIMTGDGRTWHGERFFHGIPDSDWHHVVIQIDLESREFMWYVDSRPSALVILKESIVKPGMPLVLSTQFVDNAFKGSIDEVAVFDRKLTSDEVDILYETGRSGINLAGNSP